MTSPQSSGGSPAISPRSSVISGMAGDGGGDRVGKADAVDGQRAAGRQGVGVGHPHDQRAGAAHFLVQQADGVALLVVGAEAVGADQFGQARR